MNIEYPIFETKPGTVIRVYSATIRSGSICGYCRALILEHDLVRFVGGFRRFTDRMHGVSSAKPTFWGSVPIAQVTIRIVPEKPWMRLLSRSDLNLHPSS